MNKVFLFAISALLLASCQKGNNEAVVGEGRIAITASASGDVVTRADGFTLPTPQLSDFSLTITGENFEKSWASLSDYRTENERFTKGYYDVAINYGDSTAEGYNLPCFSASKSIEVLDRDRTTEVTLNAKLTNSIITVVTTDAFNGFFPVSDFTVTTATNTFEVDKQSAEHLFVAAAQQVTIDCSCIRQSNLATEKRESLTTQIIPATEAATRYIVTYDLTTAGSVKVEVKLNDSVIDTIEIETELNPNA